MPAASIQSGGDAILLGAIRLFRRVEAESNSCDEWVIVIGAGGLGLSADLILRALAHERCSRDVDNTKLNAAAKAGAAAVVNSGDADGGDRSNRCRRRTTYGAVDW
jgi:D-arabinose 1-dehydrogenase-like Zn-dependent alcohol dehydrogenase